MLQQISSNKKIYACPHVGAPFLWGPGALCGRTGRTCLNPPLGIVITPRELGNYLLTSNLVTNYKLLIKM